MYNHTREGFHDKCEQVKGKRISLPKSARRFETLGWFPIDQDRIGNHGNALHNPVSEHRREVHLPEHPL